MEINRAFEISQSNIDGLWGENSELGSGSVVSWIREIRGFAVRLIYSVYMWLLQEFLRNVIYRRIHWPHRSTPPRPTHSVTWRSQWGATIAEIAEAPTRMVVGCTFPVDSVILITCIKIRSVNSSSDGGGQVSNGSGLFPSRTRRSRASRSGIGRDLRQPSWMNWNGVSPRLIIRTFSCARKSQCG